MRIIYNKLVRDRIPEIIAREGRRPVTRFLDDDGYRSALLTKLVEEVQEARHAGAGDLPGELADVTEVLVALAATVGLTCEQLAALAAAKRAERGGFTDRIFLEYIDPH